MHTRALATARRRLYSARSMHTGAPAHVAGCTVWLCMPLDCSEPGPFTATSNTEMLGLQGVRPLFLLHRMQLACSAACLLASLWKKGRREGGRRTRLLQVECLPACRRFFFFFYFCWLARWGCGFFPRIIIDHLIGPRKSDAGVISIPPPR